MGIRFYAPSRELREVVARTYAHQDEASALDDPRWLIVPDGDVKLIFPIRGDIRCRIAEHERVHHAGRLIVSGMRTEPGQLSFPEGVDAIGVILKPEGAYRVLGVPHHEITNQTFDGEEIFGRRARELQSELSWLERQDDRVAHLHRRLAEWLRPASDPMFDAAVGQLRRFEGTVRIEALAEALGWSRRQLERRFLVRVGVGPKSLASIFRFHAVYKRIRQSRDGHYGDLIRHYFDQSHFVKSFKRYSGLTPTAYFRVNDYGRLYIPEKPLIRQA